MTRVYTTVKPLLGNNYNHNSEHNFNLRLSAQRPTEASLSMCGNTWNVIQCLLQVKPLPTYHKKWSRKFVTNNLWHPDTEMRELWPNHDNMQQDNCKRHGLFDAADGVRLLHKYCHKHVASHSLQVTCDSALPISQFQANNNAMRQSGQKNDFLLICCRWNITVTVKPLPSQMCHDLATCSTQGRIVMLSIS